MVRKKTAAFRDYDSARYLDTPAKVAAYLEDFLSNGDQDPALLTHALGVVVRARGGIAKVAAEVGMTRAGLHKALSRSGNPSFGTALKVMKAVGVKLCAEPA
jgi:probable addiction module antidote protein